MWMLGYKGVLKINSVHYRLFFVQIHAAEKRLHLTGDFVQVNNPGNTPPEVAREMNW